MSGIEITIDLRSRVASGTVIEGGFRSGVGVGGVMVVCLREHSVSEKVRDNRGHREPAQFRLSLQILSQGGRERYLYPCFVVFAVCHGQEAVNLVLSTIIEP
jgi:hypothetical protein